MAFQLSRARLRVLNMDLATYDLAKLRREAFVARSFLASGGKKIYQPLHQKLVDNLVRETGLEPA